MPSKKELKDDVGKLKNGRASKKSGILPEIVKAACCGDDILSRLMEFVHDFCRKCTVLDDWHNAILLRITEKGELSCCDN